MSTASLVKRILGYEAVDSSLPALKYGREMEEEARSAYVREHIIGHRHSEVKYCGLFVVGDKVFLGASPDGIIKCSCWDTSGLKIKCSSHSKTCHRLIQSLATGRTQATPSLATDWSRATPRLATGRNGTGFVWERKPRQISISLCCHRAWKWSVVKQTMLQKCWMFKLWNIILSSIMFFFFINTLKLRIVDSFSYYSKVQHQMGVTGTRWCQFFVYTRQGHVTIKVNFDEDRWNELVERSRRFFHECISKEMVDGALMLIFWMFMNKKILIFSLAFGCCTIYIDLTGKRWFVYSRMCRLYPWTGWLWEEKKKGLSRNPKGVRWHLAIIRLCIALSAKSPAAYELLRTSGFFTLPTQRTLRCYTNFTASEAGFNKEFLARVCQDIKLKGLGEIERNIMLAFNEMKVFQGLVYSHQTGHIIGFTSLSSAADEMAAFARKCEGEDPQMASHTLVLMARGICTSFCGAVAYFATGGATTELWREPNIWKPVGFLLEDWSAMERHRTGAYSSCWLHPVLSDIIHSLGKPYTVAIQ